MSKGSKQRPKQISDKLLEAKWDRIFNRSLKKASKSDKPHHMNVEIK